MDSCSSGSFKLVNSDRLLGPQVMQGMGKLAAEQWNYCSRSSKNLLLSLIIVQKLGIAVCDSKRLFHTTLTMQLLDCIVAEVFCPRGIECCR